MDNVVRLFPRGRRHARTSSRAANRVSKSEVTPASIALLVPSNADQYSAGILSLWCHLETCVAEAPGNSEAKASRDFPHNSMIERNEVKSVMAQSLGQLVLKSKANPSLDCDLPLGHNVRMATKSKKSLSDYDLGFLARTFAAREALNMTQDEFAEQLGGMSQDTYKQYETRGPLPHHLIDPFLNLTGVSWEYLFTGRGEGPAWRERYKVLVERQKTKKKLKSVA